MNVFLTTLSQSAIFTDFDWIVHIDIYWEITKTLRMTLHRERHGYDLKVMLKLLVRLRPLLLAEWQDCAGPRDLDRDYK
jgi:hypothetical protein